MGWRTDRDLELLPCRLAGARWRDSSKRTVRPTSDQVLEGGRSQLETVREYVSGLDVHKKSVVAAVITPQGRRVKTFSTTTRALLELVDWLKAEGGAPRGDGEHRDLLAAHLQPPRADRDGGAGGQRRSHEAGAGTEDGRQGRGVDRRAPPVRAAEGELRPPPWAARAARLAPLPADADRAAGGRGEAGTEAAGGCQHQAGQRRCRRARGQRAGNVGGPDRGPAEHRRACSPGPGSHEEQAAAVGGGAGGFVRSPSALDAAPPPGPDRLPRHQAEGAGRGGGRADAPFPGGAEPP